MAQRETAPVRRSDILPPMTRDPFLSFRREMDRLFDDFFAPSRMGLSSEIERAFDFRPAVDLTENDKEVCVRAELPGVDEKDIDISLDRDVLTIRGEKRQERNEESEHRRVFERSYGSFERSIRLPFEPNDQDVRADFKNGVLTVKAIKPPELAKQTKRIPIARTN